MAGVYVHFPFCKSKCAYCSFVSTPNYAIQNDYFSRLKTEIEQNSGGVDIDTIYFGGGTPSVVKRGKIAEIAKSVKQKFHLLPDYEFTVECNPESVNSEFIDEILSAGVNRVSIGLQSANDAVLKKIGRIHTVQDFVGAVEKIKSSGIKNISGDLILGLPDQSETMEQPSLRNLKDLQH